jgi:Cu(I)/Ag(I) efflux system membrane fusion protein
MKILKLFITAIFSVALSITTSAQHDHSSMGSNSNMNMNMNSHMTMLPPKTETLKVWGKCDKCKARIEKIALTSGATTADWNVKTKLLTVNFDPARTSVDYISNKLAKAGYDTENYKAKDKAYNALPDCCKYERVK